MTETKKKISPAVSEKAIEASKAETGEGIRTLTSGVRVRLNSVPLGLIEEVTSAVEEPDVPMWYNPDKDREEPNPNNPEYVKAVKKADRERSIAAIETCIMFGFDLVDGMPDSDDWLEKIKFLEMKGRIDLSQYDLDNPYHREFIYKRYVAVAGTEDLKLVQNMVTGINPEDIEGLREGKFLDDETRDADREEENN